MRRNDRKITDKKIIDDILNSANICRLGLCENNIPYIVPVNFGYRNNSLYIHCATEGRKLDIIRNNPNVCFEIELDVEIIMDKEACKSTTRYKSVIGYGRASILTDNQQKIEVLDIIMHQHGGLGNYKFKPKVLDMMLALRIDINEISGKQSG